MTMTSPIFTDSEPADLARARLIARLYDCKAQSDRIYAQTRLFARFASPFRFELKDRAMQIFGRDQRRLRLLRADSGASIAFTLHDDDTVEITHGNCPSLRNQPRQKLTAEAALAALDAYLELALATPENIARLQKPASLPRTDALVRSH